MKAIIIEDEENNIGALTARLGHIKDVEIVGVARDVQPGIKLIEQVKPDLVFLDIKLPSGTAFQLLDALSVIPFDIIITTAYDDKFFLKQAIEYEACAYLQKPFSVDQLRGAIEKVNNKQLKQNKKHTQPNGNSKIVVTTKEPALTSYIIAANDIIFLQGINGFTKFYLTENVCITSSKNIGYFMQKLKNHTFFMQVHKHFLVNLNHIKKFEDAKESGTIHFDSIAETADIGMNYKSNFMKWLKNLE